MPGIVYDQEGRSVATIHEGELIDTEGHPVGAVRNKNVYDCNGKFVFHLQPEGEEVAGRMTNEAVFKLLHPKPRA